MGKKPVDNVLANVDPTVPGTFEYECSASGIYKSGFQLDLTPGTGSLTVTLLGTLADNKLPVPQREYYDITKATFGEDDFTTSIILNDDAGKLAVYEDLKVKIVVVGNDGKYKITQRSLRGE